LRFGTKHQEIDMSEPPKYIMFRTETLFESVTSDFVSLVTLVFCIWFSHHMHEPHWTFATFLLFAFWLNALFSFESTRVQKFRTKQEAIDWANGLPE
jgi:hypothetical protein